MAVEAIYRGEAQPVFIWLALAALIDATDGTLARRFDVKSWVPQFDGCLLDNII
ncbi:MAG: CDP-alcohol phosphatidyltransferase family protein, partial [Firmicutes bacterium]|nr:CDP-alcohol phosphatidyltransferase family protein [Bacillota bacterium]